MRQEPVGTDQSSVYEDTRAYIRRARGQMSAMRRALEQSMNNPEGMEWEEQLGAPQHPPEPEPTPESVAPMEPPTTAWEAKRRQWLHEQLEQNWPSRKPPFKRKPWRSGR